MPPSFTRNSPIRLNPTRRLPHLLTILLLWAAVYVASLARPPLLDDADATHAQAAQAMLRTGDWVTLHVNGIRYLEKAPLPYWIAACSLWAFGDNSFAVHLPLALTVLGLALLAWRWGARAFGERAGFYAALFTLTGTGIFLFTRVFIPDALLSLLLALALYSALRALEIETVRPSRWAILAWLALAAAVLTKGLVAIVFLFAALALYLWLAGERTHWRRLAPVTGGLLFLAIAGPWHILAGLRNTGGANGHGFFWFYFINEHVLRFLGRRTPVDYNKLPALLYWSLHLAWLFPWSLFLPLAALLWWQRRKPWLAQLRSSAPHTFAWRSSLLLSLFSAFVLVFFSFSTNQEYYTFPVYLPVLLLIAAAIARVEEDPRLPPATSDRSLRFLLGSHWALFAVCLGAAGTLAVGLWSARGLPSTADLGDLLAHRNVGNYTLSMSHFFDLTGPSFSALRLPAALACAALALGPALALLLRVQRRHLASTVTVALTSAVFLIAAQIALTRFGTMLSSADFARLIQRLETTGQASPDSKVMLFGDQAFGSSIPFYLGHPVQLVDGRSTSMLFGSTFPDIPPIFLTHADLLARWGSGPRKLLFVPSDRRPDVDRLLGGRQIVIYQSAGKALITDRPLDAPRPGNLAGDTH